MARLMTRTDLSRHPGTRPERDYNVAMRRVAFIAVLLAGTAAFCSPPDPCSLTSTITDAKVTIAVPDGRTSFREGEIIPLSLSFTSTVDKRYWADNRNYDRSGRLNIENYCVSGLGSEQQLSKKPFTAIAELNEWRQPGPGHYRLYVVSHCDVSGHG